MAAPKPDALRGQALMLLSEGGRSVRQVADMLGVGKSTVADWARMAETYTNQKSPPEHDHMTDAGQPAVIGFDLHGTLTPAMGFPLAPPYPGVQEWTSLWASQGVCLHISTAALYPNDPPDILLARERMIWDWVTTYNLPISFVTGKVPAHCYYDDRMVNVDRHHPDPWSIAGPGLNRQLALRAALKEGIWELVELPEVGDPIANWPDEDEVPGDRPRGYTTPVLDVDLHRCVLRANSSANDSGAASGAQEVINRLFDANYTIHPSCAGWDPAEKDKVLSGQRLRGLQRTLLRSGIRWDLIVAKKHATAYADDHGEECTGDWLADEERIRDRLGPPIPWHAVHKHFHQVGMAEKTDQAADPERRKRGRSTTASRQSRHADEWERKGGAVEADTAGSTPGSVPDIGRSVAAHGTAAGEMSGAGLEGGVDANVSSLGTGGPADYMVGDTQHHDHPVIDRTYLEAFRRYANLVNNGVGRRHALTAVQAIHPDFYIEEAQHAWLIQAIARRAKAVQDWESLPHEPVILAKMTEETSILDLVAAIDKPEMPPEAVRGLVDQYQLGGHAAVDVADHLYAAAVESYLAGVNGQLVAWDAEPLDEIPDRGVLEEIRASSDIAARELVHSYNRQLVAQVYGSWVETEALALTEATDLAGEISRWKSGYVADKAEGATAEEAQRWHRQGVLDCGQPAA